MGLTPVDFGVIFVTVFATTLATKLADLILKEAGRRAKQAKKKIEAAVNDRKTTNS